MSEPKPDTIVATLKQRAAETPEHIAFHYLSGGDAIEQSVTYRKLDHNSRRVAARLQNLALRNERVVLLYVQGLDFIEAFMGCLYAGTVAVPAYPPRKNSLSGRIETILENSGARAVLTTGAVKKNIDRNFPGIAAAYPVLVHEETTEPAAAYRPEDAAGADALAFLQYTSGSTGNPKGVMIGHDNIMVNLADFDLGHDYPPGSSICSWLPAFHDLGLIYGILFPLYKGIPGYLLSPVTFLARPFSWLQAMSCFKATHTIAPNFAYDMCLAGITGEQLQTLDLAHVELLGNAAEPVRAETIRGVVATLAATGLKESAVAPGYGLAEATLKVSAKTNRVPALILSVDASALERHRVQPVNGPAPGAKQVVSSGLSRIDTRVRIVHPATGAGCAENEVGEIWVGGKTIARGYWQNPAATRETFRAFTTDTREGPFLRTGDLGFVLEGQLFVSGRLKELIIIRGYNHYPTDIECTVRNAHPSLLKSTCAAFSVEADGAETLAVVVEVKNRHLSGPEAAEIFARVREHIVGEHGIEAHTIALVHLAAIPKTSSGKIRRNECRRKLLDDELNAIAVSRAEAPPAGAVPTLPVLPADEWAGPPHDEQPDEQAVRNRVSGAITAALTQLTGLPLIEPDRSFHQLGLNSVKAMKLTHALEAALGVPVPVTLLFEAPTAGQLADRLCGVLLPAAAGATDAAAADPSPADAELGALSEEELCGLLLKEIHASNRP